MFSQRDNLLVLKLEQDYNEHKIYNLPQTGSNDGQLFAFLPDYYIESLTELSMGLAFNFALPESVVQGL